MYLGNELSKRFGAKRHNLGGAASEVQQAHTQIQGDYDHERFGAKRQI
jgi:hypothetical protein